MCREVIGFSDRGITNRWSRPPRGYLWASKVTCGGSSQSLASRNSNLHIVGRLETRPLTITEGIDLYDKAII